MKKLHPVLFAVLAFFSMSLIAQPYQAEQQYVSILPAPPQQTGDEVEVIEFFWYGCPHCFDFDPFVEKWLESKPENVVFKRVPVMFGGAANLHAKMYYTLEVMGQVDKLHNKIFEVMQKERRKLASITEIEEFMDQQGIDLDKFQDAWESFAVQTKVNRASALMRRYGVRGVPSLVVDGRYRSGNGFKNYDHMMGLADFLVVKVLDDRKGGKTAK